MLKKNLWNSLKSQLVTFDLVLNKLDCHHDFHNKWRTGNGIIKKMAKSKKTHRVFHFLTTSVTFFFYLQDYKTKEISVQTEKHKQINNNAEKVASINGTSLFSSLISQWHKNFECINIGQNDSKFEIFAVILKELIR